MTDMEYKKHFKSFSEAMGNRFKEFIDTMDKRMAKGYEEYGDGSFKLPPDELLREVEEEVLDICGWSLILYTRIKNIRNKIGSIDVEKKEK